MDELFQTFQLSPSLLNPSQNPSLFRSTLVVIAKVRTNVISLETHSEPKRLSQDVMDSNASDITKECVVEIFIQVFDLLTSGISRLESNLRHMLELDKDSNFVTLRHAGNVAIIPWPVIESRQFYLLLPTLKKVLRKQEITHSRAATFLHTMKTMMAKLKVADLCTNFSDISDVVPLDKRLESHYS